MLPLLAGTVSRTQWGKSSLAQVTNDGSKGCIETPFWDVDTPVQKNYTISPGPDGGCGGTRVQNEPFDFHIVEEHGHSWLLQDSSVCLKWSRILIFFVSIWLKLKRIYCPVL